MKGTIHLVTVFLLIACGPSRDQELADEPTLGLTGSWTLASLDLGDSTYRAKNTSSAIIQKHLTKTHFAWLYYDPERDRMICMAGGTYTIHDDRYTEQIKYYLPSGSNKLGRQQDYSYRVDQKEWVCTGFDKVYGFELERGEILPVDSTFLEQKWVRIAPKANNDPQLLGTWLLQKYRSEADSTWQTYPDFVGYLKLITPSHFFWIKYNSQYDEVMSGGGGLYSYSGGDVYQETIESFYPHDSQLVGSEIKFEQHLENQAWKHRGLIKRTDDNIVVDSTLVDEVWIAYKKPKKTYGAAD